MKINVSDFFRAKFYGLGLGLGSEGLRKCFRQSFEKNDFLRIMLEAHVGQTNFLDIRATILARQQFRVVVNAAQLCSPAVAHSESLVLHALREHLVEVVHVSLVPHRQGVPRNPPDAPDT